MNVVYDDENLSVTIEGLDEVQSALGELKAKAPAAVKAAINATARETRKVLIKAAKARYAVNAAGARHLNDLSTKNGKGHSATLAKLEAVLYDAKLKSDLGYFQHEPTQAYTGLAAVARKGTFYYARVLKKRGMADLRGGSDKIYGEVSKGFLIEFKSGHVGMVQRDINSESENTVTHKSGALRWKNKRGQVEKLVTMGAPSAVAMHGKVWPEKEPEIEQYLLDNLEQQMLRVVERYSGR